MSATDTFESCLARIDRIEDLNASSCYSHDEPLEDIDWLCQQLRKALTSLEQIYAVSPFAAEDAAYQAQRVDEQ